MFTARRSQNWCLKNNGSIATIAATIETTSSPVVFRLPVSVLVERFGAPMTAERGGA